MEKKNVADARKGIAFVFVILLLTGAFVLLPSKFRTQAERVNAIPVAKIGYFDIRTDKSSADILNNFRSEKGLSAIAVADQRSSEERNR